MANIFLKRLWVAGSAAALAATLALAQDKPAAKVAAPAIPLGEGTRPGSDGARALSRITRMVFRGVKFGSPSSSFKGLTLVTDRGSMKIYQKSGDDLNIGSCQLDKILYHFVTNDKFMRNVSLFPKDIDDGQSLRQIFEIAFGEGATAKPHADSGEHHQHADEFSGWRGKIANAPHQLHGSKSSSQKPGSATTTTSGCAMEKVQKKNAEDAAASLF